MTVKRLRKLTVTTTLRMSSVPDKAVHDEYISRKIDGMSEFDIFDYARKTTANILIEGPTGPGKTMAARAYAAREGLHFYAVPCNVGVEPSQLFGKYIPNEDKADDNDPSFVWVDGPVTDIVRNGGLLLFNEVNFLPPRVGTVVFGLLDGRREMTLLDHKGEVIRAHRPQCWCGSEDCSDQWVTIIADMNPEYEGTIGLNKAFRNRFGIQLEWDYDSHVETKLIAGPTLRRITTNMRNLHRDGEIETPISTNMLMEFERIVADLGLQFAITNFVNHFAASERSSIRQCFDAVLDNLNSDYAPPAPPGDPKAIVDDGPVDDFDWSDIANDNDFQWIRNGEGG